MTSYCAQCLKTVYFAEEVKALGKKWHKLCLKCGSCNRLLDSGSLTDHDGRAYCRNCHGKLFGPKGFGYAGTLSMAVGNSDPCQTTTSNIPATAEAYVAPRRQSTPMSGAPLPTDQPDGSTPRHLSGGSCPDNGMSESRESLDSGFDGGPISAGAQRASQPMVGRKGLAVQNGQAKDTFGVNPCCPRCGQTVYVAELMRGAGRSYHRACFRCFNDACGKRLDQSTLCDKDSQIYCKACYGKLFGPKGVGFGVGAGCLTTE